MNWFLVIGVVIEKVSHFNEGVQKNQTRFRITRCGSSWSASKVGANTRDLVGGGTSGRGCLTTVTFKGDNESALGWLNTNCSESLKPMLFENLQVTFSQTLPRKILQCSLRAGRMGATKMGWCRAYVVGRNQRVRNHVWSFYCAIKQRTIE